MNIHSPFWAFCGGRKSPAHPPPFHKRLCQRIPLFLLLFASFYAYGLQGAPTCDELRQARSLFSEGDFPGALSLIEKTWNAKPKTCWKEMEDLKRLQGVTLFLMGKNAESEKIFSELFALNPASRLTSQESVQPNLVDAFEGARNRALSQGADGTALLLILQTPNATVTLDKKTLKSPSGKLPLEPGPHKLVIEANGFQTQVHEFTLKKGETQKFNIKLSPAQTADTRMNMPNPGSATLLPEAAPNGALVPGPSPTDGTWRAPGTIANNSSRPPSTTGQSVSGKGLHIIHFLPFGAGQFRNGDTGKGLVVGTLQGLSLGIWYIGWSGYRSRSEGVEGASCSHDDLAKWCDMQLAGLATTGGLWILGSVEAVYTATHTPSEAPAPRVTFGAAPGSLSAPWLPSLHLNAQF